MRRIIFIVVPISLAVAIGFLCLPAESQTGGSFVALQGSTPGTAQSGHVNITGTLRTGGFTMPTGAAAGHVLTSNGTGVATWMPPAGLTLPYSGSTNFSNGLAFHVINLGTGAADGIQATTNSNAGYALIGNATATSGETIGAYGLSISPDGYGVFGSNGAGSGNGYGGYFRTLSSAGRAVFGVATANSGTTHGGYFEAWSTGGTGVFGYATASTGSNWGGRFESFSTSGVGVLGQASANSGSTVGVRGTSASPSGRGVVGSTSATTGSAIGVEGNSAGGNGIGVLGNVTATTGTTNGVYGQSFSNAGAGVFGVATATSGNTYGGFFQSNSSVGTAVHGTAIATSGLNYGGRFETSSSTGTGVFGNCIAISGAAWGVWARTLSNSSTAYGVYGDEPAGGAGHAVYANGTLAATGTKSFQIDHPLDPDNYYLNHFCAEAPEPINFYSGNVVTDGKGYATVTLPNYFEEINRDFRYQLTVIGKFAQAIIAEEIMNNQFTIQTNEPRVKVSWRVEAIRNDRWVQKYGYKTEQEKENEFKGKYLNPELYNQPKERGLLYRPTAENVGKSASAKRTEPRR